MPIIDVPMQDRMLDAMLNVAASWEIALFASNPDDVDTPESVELSDETEVDDGLGGTTFVANGYARTLTSTADDWEPAEGGSKVGLATFADPSEAWETARYWAARDPATGQWGPSAAFVEPLVVPGPGTLSGPAQLVLFFTDLLEES